MGSEAQPLVTSGSPAPHPLGSSRSSQQSPGWGRPLRLLVRLVLMGVGLGVITGSVLKLAGPAVQRGELNLPSWLTPKITPADKDEQPDPAAAVINPPSASMKALTSRSGS